MTTTISDFFTFNVGDTFTIPENPDVYDFIHGGDILQFVFVETQSGFVRPFAPEIVFFILKSPQTDEPIQVSGGVADFIRSCNNLAEAMQKLAGKKVTITALTKAYTIDYTDNRKPVLINAPTIEYAE